jgi:heat shock protein HslJ
MLRTALISALTLAAAAASAKPPTLVGAWRAEDLPGVATIKELTFTADGRLIAGKNQLLGLYAVDGKRIVARSGQITYAYELTGDGRLCVSPGPTLTPLGGAPTGDPGKG